MDSQLLGRAIIAAADQVAANASYFGLAYPGDCTVEGVYKLRPATNKLPAGTNLGWTTGFVPGVAWAAWQLTGAAGLRDAALAHVASFAARAQYRIDVETHDLGFLYTLSSVTAWQLGGCVPARTAALEAADLLVQRVVEPAGIIQAWGGCDDPVQRGRTIIDSLMNMSLLCWAADQGGAVYREVARRHVGQLRDHMIRPDGSTFHTFYWDPVSGAPLYGGTQQGHANGSCWARGQAWGVLGFALAYRHLGDPSFLDASRRCADYLLRHLPGDGVPVWDLSFGEGDGQPRDSSAAAIAVCGLLELAGQLGAGDAAAEYRAAAEKTMEALMTGYVPAEAVPQGPLLLHGVYDLPQGNGVDEGSLWGDYFYMEALLRLSKDDWHPWW